jgi:hypothetical protein
MSVGGGTSRAEALLEERRRVLRTALKGEYIRKKYDPKAYSAEGGLIFDAAVQRWHALQFTYGDHFKPTFTNFVKYGCTGFIPVFLFYQWCWGPHHKEYSRAVKRGEVAYDADSRRGKYFN